MRELRQYWVFIGSPGGLEEERRLFAERIAHFNEVHGEPDGIVFKAVAWEDTLPGPGRAQERINEDLKRCDYAVFLFHDRWGTVAGPSGKVGTEEEWDIAQQMYDDTQLSNLCLFFKTAPSRPGADATEMAAQAEQMRQVEVFKQAIIAARKHQYKDFPDAAAFAGVMDRLLAEWGRGLRGRGAGGLDGAPLSPGPDGGAGGEADAAPPFAYWLAESRRLADTSAAEFDPRGALVFAERALKAAPEGDAVAWARAENARGNALAHTGDMPAALESYDAIDKLLGHDLTPEGRERVAVALVNKGFTLGQMGRAGEALAAYDAAVERFGADSAPALREEVARALVNKGGTLGQMGRAEEALAACDVVAERFGADSAPALRERVARALVNKGVALRQMGRAVEAVAAYDAVVERFGADRAPALREEVARALVNKGGTLGQMGRAGEAVAACDAVVERFGADRAPVLRKEVARALVNKGVALRQMGRAEEALAAYDLVLERFGADSAPALREQVAKTLVKKGAALVQMGRVAEALFAYDAVLERFGDADEDALKRLVDIARARREELARRQASGRRRDK